MAAYTAFGELVRPDGTIGYDPNVALPTRYQYAGGWGYENGVMSLYGANPDLPPVVLMHVGARWYQPDIGRFVQRDPIGTAGGMNVYAYCENLPLICIDPSGLGAIGKAIVDVLGADAVIWITGGKESWLDDADTVRTAQAVALGVGVGAAVGAVCVAALGADVLLWGGMKAGRLVNPRPIPLAPPSPPPSWPGHYVPPGPKPPHPFHP